MSKEFIQAKVNSSYIADAIKQQNQLSYFTESSLQENSITADYISQWASRHYQSTDYFLNYIKSIFKTDVFLKFFKYLRKPLPSTKLIKNRIEPQLNRVFIAENSDFKYYVNGIDQSKIKETLNNSEFEKDLFYHILYKHNSILISDVDNEKAYRFFLDINDVVSIEEENNKKINKIAFNAVVNIDNKKINGVAYIDKDYFRFYDNQLNLIKEVDNELGYNPAHYIANHKYKNQPVVQESLFTFIREEIEEYVFLKTLQKMTEPSGAIPVTTTIDVPIDTSDIDSKDKAVIDDEMGSQQSSEHSTNPHSGIGLLDPGMVHRLPLKAITTQNGDINPALLDAFINFKYIPVDILTYLNDRIKEVEDSLLITTVGDILGRKEEAQNELQIEKSITTLQNNLLHIADLMNRARALSDKDQLGLTFGIKSVSEVFIFYGTDFFLDSETKLYNDLEKAPNPIERKNILIRINQNKYKSNQDQMVRQKILYELLPFVSDNDFKVARGANQVEPELMQYQIRFTYWINLFEAKYGDIVSFYNEMDIDRYQKFIVINNLIIELINQANENNPSFNRKDSVA